MEGQNLKWITLFADRQKAEASIAEGEIMPVYLKLQDKRIAIARKNNQWFAFDNKCPHKDVPLHTGHLNNEYGIVCKLHSYVWDMHTGTQLSGEACAELKIYPLKFDEEGKLKIGLY